MHRRLFQIFSLLDIAVASSMCNSRPPMARSMWGLTTPAQRTLWPRTLGQVFRSLEWGRNGTGTQLKATKPGMAKYY